MRLSTASDTADVDTSTRTITSLSVESETYFPAVGGPTDQLILGALAALGILLKAFPSWGYVGLCWRVLEAMLEGLGGSLGAMLGYVGGFWRLC